MLQPILGILIPKKCNKQVCSSPKLESYLHMRKEKYYWREGGGGREGMFFTYR